MGGRSAFSRAGHFVKSQSKTGTVVSSSKQKWDCRYCKAAKNKAGMELGRALTTHTNHYRVCASKPDSERRTYDAKGEEVDEDSSELEDDDIATLLPTTTNAICPKKRRLSEMSIDSDCGPTQSKRMKKGHITSYVLPALTPKDQARVTQLFSYAHAYKAVAAAFFECEFVLEALRILRPDYKPPKRKELHGKLLEKRVEEMEGIVKNKLRKAGSVQLGSDGSQDRSEKVEHVCALTPAPVLVYQHRHGAAKIDAAAIYADLLAGKKVCAESGAEILGVIMDNPNISKAAARKWRQSEGTGAPGCASHGDALLMGDICGEEPYATAIKQAKRLNMRLNRSKMGDFLREYKLEHRIKQKLAKKFPAAACSMSNQVYRDTFFKLKDASNKRIGRVGESATRQWSSNVFILQRLLRDQEQIQRLCDRAELPRTKDYLKYKGKNADGSESSVDFQAMIQDGELWSTFQVTYDKLAELRTQLCISQSDEFSLSDVFYQYKMLAKHYPEYENEVTQRWNLICDIQHSACFFTDPRYLKASLAEAESKEESDGGDDENAHENESEADDDAVDADADEEDSDCTSVTVALTEMESLSLGDEDDDSEEEDAMEALQQKAYELTDEEDAEFLEAAMGYLKEYFGEDEWNRRSRQLFLEFRTKTGDFADLQYPQPCEGMDASRQWWKERSLLKRGRSFAGKMEKLMRLVGTNAQLERSFNFVRRIHTSQRGALGPKTVDKLVYVAANVTFCLEDVYEMLRMKKALKNLRRKSAVKELGQAEQNFMIEDMMKELGVEDMALFDADGLDNE